MATLIVTEQGARLTIDGIRFVVERKGHAIQSLRCDETERILLLGGIELTSACIRRVLTTGCDLTFLTKDGRYRGRIQGPRSPNVRVRVAQIVRLQDPTFRVELGRSIVRGKLRNQRALLLRSQRRLADAQLAKAIGRLRTAETSLPRAATGDAIRGVEGAGSAAFFSGFGAALRNPDFAFSGRNRRPPRDPVNACLSFGYTILTSAVADACERVGLDPMVGALHELDYGRPSLALDLVEEWRAVLVDSLVLRLLNRRQLTPRDFGPPERDVTDEVMADVEVRPLNPPDAVLLRPTGRRIFLREWLRRLRERVAVPDRRGTWRYEDVLEFQARRMARLFQGEVMQYDPFLTR